MINHDDLEPARKAAYKPLDLQVMSIDELREYIATLKNEIERADGVIKKKEQHKHGVDALFRTN